MTVVLDPGDAFAELDRPLRERVTTVTGVWAGHAEDSEDFARTKGEMGRTEVVGGFPETPVDTNGAGTPTPASSWRSGRREPLGPTAAEIDAYLGGSGEPDTPRPI